MSTKSNALTKKIGQVTDYFKGITRVDNSANPASAYSMAKRKRENTLPRGKQKPQPIGKGY